MDGYGDGFDLVVVVLFLSEIFDGCTVGVLHRLCGRTPYVTSLAAPMPEVMNWVICFSHYLPRNHPKAPSYTFSLIGPCVYRITGLALCRMVRVGSHSGRLGSFSQRQSCRSNGSGPTRLQSHNLKEGNLDV